MKQQVWSSPKTAFEEFVPQNYIAACGDENVVYKFTCAVNNNEYGGVWQETNGQPGLQVESSGNWWAGTYVEADKKISSSYKSFHGCNVTHEAKVTDDFLMNCYYLDKDDYPDNTANAIPVVVWKGPNKDNVHCNPNIVMDTWETTKS